MVVGVEGLGLGVPRLGFSLVMFRVFRCFHLANTNSRAWRDSGNRFHETGRAFTDALEEDVVDAHVVEGASLIWGIGRQNVEFQCNEGSTERAGAGAPHRPAAVLCNL